jgi:hypothetical protein
VGQRTRRKDRRRGQKKRVDLVREGRPDSNKEITSRIDYQQNSEQNNSTFWKSIKERQIPEDIFTPIDRIYRNLTKDNLSALDLEIYDQDDPELIRLMGLINKLRSREIRPEDLIKSDAEIVAEILSKI